MISVENFYYILYKNLLEPARFVPFYFYPFGTTDVNKLQKSWNNENPIDIYISISNAFGLHSVLFYDQEPLLTDSQVYGFQIELEMQTVCKLFANSEHSSLKNNFCKKENFLDWYYFYHGFASLFWLNDFKYLSDIEQQFTKVFISLNRLHTNHRSYRLNLVNEYLKRDILSKGIVSLPLNNQEFGSWCTELNDPNTLLPKNKLDEIKTNLSQFGTGIVADKIDPQGFLSADCGMTSYHLFKKAFIHVVSESVFYHNKLHLTEKIFKPIAIKRPFILTGAPGNLRYLKSYGFETFGKWIDESYDDELDHDIRINKIVNEVEKLCKLTMSDLRDLHYEMRFVLEHNFNHFFNDFRTIITDELLENFKKCVQIYNNGRYDNLSVNLDKIDFHKVRKLFLR